MVNHRSLLAELKVELLSCLEYLEYSYKKTKEQAINLSTNDPEELETLEALVSRFARSTDIFIAKYLRTYCLKDDPAYSGTLIDTILYAEKFKLIGSAKVWIEIRELRNKISHEYARKDLEDIFDQVLKLAPTVLDLKNTIL